MKEKTVLAWYFAPEDNRLRHGDNRPIVIGEAHTVENQPVACKHGLHGSRRIIDALRYAPGPMLYRVELGGLMDAQDDKIAAQSRRYIAGFDATDLLQDFARRCALDVIHLWDAPDVVVQYLKMGDELIRDAARAAARDAARAAARDAARDAAWDAAWAAVRAAARDAARAAARDAAWAAVRDAAWAAVRAAAWAAAWDAARDAAWAAVRAAVRAAAWDAVRAAAWDKQNRRLTAMVSARFKELNP